MMFNRMRTEESFILCHLNKPFDSSMMSRSIVSTKISCFRMPKKKLFWWVSLGIRTSITYYFWCGQRSKWLQQREWWQREASEKKEHNHLLHWNNRWQRRARVWETEKWKKRGERERETVRHQMKAYDVCVCVLCHFIGCAWIIRILPCGCIVVFHWVDVLWP